MLSAKFDPEALMEYIYWQTEDRKTLKKINQLLIEILRNPFEGIGKPEPLKGDLSGYWSRRIDHKNRLVYKVEGDNIEIQSCKSHYGD
jgi:toxin YoeB